MWHVPDLDHSLLSVNKLKVAGCWHISGKKGDMTEYFFDRSDTLWLECRYENGLNVPSFSTVINPVYKTQWIDYTTQLQQEPAKLYNSETFTAYRPPAEIDLHTLMTKHATKPYITLQNRYKVVHNCL